MFSVIKVVGESMQPSLNPGDFVLVQHRWFAWQITDIAVADHCEFGQIIKRVIAIDALKGVLLAGDSPCGVASAQLGWFAGEQLVGKVRWAIRKPL